MIRSRTLGPIRCLTAILASLALSIAHAETSPPAPFEAVYRISGMGVTLAEGKVRLRHTESGYVYERETSVQGLASLFRSDEVSERSVGRFEGARPVPLQYEYLLKAEGKDRNERIVFDPRGATATDSYKGKTTTLDLPPLYQDRASQELALIADLQAGETRLEYAVVERHKLKDYGFEIVGEEQLEVPFGRFRTLKLRVLRDTDKRSTELWVAPELGYLPVRTDHIEKGYRASMELVSLRR